MKRIPIAWIRSPKPYPDVIGDCIICTSHKPSKRGYPRTNINYKPTNIARLVFMRKYGTQSPDIKCRHSCDNLLCINPDHLIAGSQADNVRDSVVRGRNHRGERTGGSKLKEIQIHEIRRLLSIGTLQKDIAKQFGVGRAAISGIKRGRAWAWLK